MPLSSANAATSTPAIVEWVPSQPDVHHEWEEAYLRYQDEVAEIANFLNRFKVLAVHGTPLDGAVVDLFCGRGTGLKALAAAGFTRLEGVDLNRRLLEEYNGPARLYVGDCRELAFDDESKDLVLLQGGLHHLPDFPADVNRVLAECRRVLKPGGRLLLAEPCLTPFLHLTHFACAIRPLRRVWPKLNAFAEMVDGERETYTRWLANRDTVLRLLSVHFEQQARFERMGCMLYSGEVRRTAATALRTG